MAYDRNRREVVMFGGLDGSQPVSQPLGDTWIWSEGSRLWQPAPVPGPSRIRPTSNRHFGIELVELRTGSQKCGDGF